MSTYDDDLIQLYDEVPGLAGITLKNPDDRFAVAVFVDEEGGTAVLLDIRMLPDVIISTVRHYVDGEFGGEQILDTSR